MIRTILVYVPDPRHGQSNHSEGAVSAAKAFAARFGGRLVLVSVVEVPEDFAAWTTTAGLNPARQRQELREACERELEQLAGSIETTEVRFGDAVSELYAAAQAADDPLIVAASQGRTGLRALVEGSLTYRLIQNAPCPVLLVPAAGGERKADRVGARLLAPLDGSTHATRAFELALDALVPLPEEIVLLRVIDPSSTAAQRTAAAEELESFRPRLEAAGANLTLEVREGQVVEQIANAIQDRDIDLVTLATHGAGGIRKRFIGSSAQRLLSEVPVPVLVISPRALESRRRQE
jgi:nucleotide-binding universal stress UspA family protein